MSKYTHQTAPTQFLEANGIRFAYRRFGKANGVPLVFNQHYLGTMDYWDPTVTDGLARDREVILFNNAGVSSSSGEVPTTFEQMGANAVAFTRALGLKQGGHTRLLDRRHGRAGNRAAGARSRSQVDPRGHRSTRRSGHGVADAGCRAALRRHLRSARVCLARGPIQSVRGGPGRGTGVLEAHASSSGWARSRSERQGVARPGRSDGTSGASSERGPTTI